MKQIKKNAEKLGFKTETLRKLSDSMTPDELAQVQGGMPPSGGARSSQTVVCSN